MSENNKEIKFCLRSPAPPANSSGRLKLGPRDCNFYSYRRLRKRSNFDQEETITAHVPVSNKIRSSQVQEISILSSTKLSNSIGTLFSFRGLCSIDFRTVNFDVRLSRDVSYQIGLTVNSTNQGYTILASSNKIHRKLIRFWYAIKKEEMAMKEMCYAVLSSLNVVFKTLTIEYAEVNADHLNQWCSQELNRSMVIAAMIIQNYMRKYIASAKQKSQLRQTMNAAIKKLKGMLSEKQSCLPAVMFKDICDKLSSLQQSSETSLLTGNILGVPSEKIGGSSVFSTAASSSSLENCDWNLVQKSLESLQSGNHYFTTINTGDSKILRMKNELLAISEQLSSKDFDTSQVSCLPFELSSVLPEGREEEVIPTASGFSDGKGERLASSKGAAERLRNVVQRWRLNSSSTSEASKENSSNLYTNVLGPNNWKRIPHRKRDSVEQRRSAQSREVTSPESNQVEVVDFSRISILPSCSRRVDDDDDDNNNNNNNRSSSSTAAHAAAPTIALETQTEDLELLRQDKYATVIQKFFRRRFHNEDCVPFYSAHTASDCSLLSAPLLAATDNISEPDGFDGDGDVRSDVDADLLANQYSSIELSDEELFSSEQILLEAEEAFQSEWRVQGENDLNGYAIKIQSMFRKYRTMAAYREFQNSHGENDFNSYATKIQSLFRKHRAMAAYHKFKNSQGEKDLNSYAIRIQSLFRKYRTMAAYREFMNSGKLSVFAAAAKINHNFRRYIATLRVSRLRHECLVADILAACDVRRELLLVRKQISEIQRRKKGPLPYAQWEKVVVMFIASKLVDRLRDTSVDGLRCPQRTIARSVANHKVQ
eukprot:gene32860-42539_t